ncbi:MAG: hypothetical protein ACTSSA_13560 [Candidatus Freyarchaeota archaeon]|nr:hypothetical protein [Candidatus Freyarchaeota archaeon]
MRDGMAVLLLCLVVVAIIVSLMTFLLITQAQVLSVINLVVSAAVNPSLPLYGRPALTFVAIIASIQIFAKANILVAIGINLNKIFFGNYWWFDYGISYLLIIAVIALLGSL